MEQFDKELINKIIELTKKIFKIYNTLFELEINNQKETILYKNNLKYLDLLLELETELYSKIPNNKIKSYINYSDRANLFKHFSDFTLIINDYHDNYIFKRIYNKLTNIYKTNYIQKYQEDKNEKIEPYFDLTNMLYQTINEDMLNSFIYETYKLSEKTDNYDFKNGFIMIKYLVSFLNNSIENRYKNNFNNNNKIYICNRMVSDTFNINFQDYFNTLKYYYFNLIDKEIKNIVKKDLYTNDYAFQKYRLLLQVSLIKAFNNVCSDNIYLKKIIYDIINKYNIDINLNKIDNNIINIRSERLEVYGSSK